jgi:hypothetical protein
MTVARALFVLVMMVAIGIAVVWLRTESAKVACRVQALHHEKVSLEQRLWAQDIELAQLRGLDEIRRRASELDLDVVPPAAAPEDSAGGW